MKRHPNLKQGGETLPLELKDKAAGLGVARCLKVKKRLRRGKQRHASELDIKEPVD